VKSVFLPTIAVSLAVALSLPGFAEPPLPGEYELSDKEGTAPAPTGAGGVYAKIILPMKEAVEGEHPLVESWMVMRMLEWLSPRA